ncbi:MAG TPA: hemerythrin family protein [Anaeromyxobacteraceae bacterium]|nr:hemerythrin family protein [Anaeromyxobacteraceae bacterium]
MRPPSGIVFDPLLETGNRLVDRQHRELFARLGALFEASREGRGADEVRPLLGYLREYVDAHLAAEERLMEEAGYPDLEPHREEHRALLATFQALQAQFEESGADLLFVVRLSQRVTEWLKEHIYRADRTMAWWLRGRGG